MGSQHLLWTLKNPQEARVCNASKCEEEKSELLGYDAVENRDMRTRRMRVAPDLEMGTPGKEKANTKAKRKVQEKSSKRKKKKELKSEEDEIKFRHEQVFM